MIAEGIIILNHVKRFFPLCNGNNEYVQNKKNASLLAINARYFFFFFFLHNRFVNIDFSIFPGVISIGAHLSIYVNKQTLVSKYSLFAPFSFAVFCYLFFNLP